MTVGYRGEFDMNVNRYRSRGRAKKRWMRKERVWR